MLSSTRGALYRIAAAKRLTEMVLPTVWWCQYLLWQTKQSVLTSTWRRNEDLLRQVLPSVELQQLLVVSLKGAGRLRLVKDSGAGSDELLVELPLVGAAVPALTVESFQGAPAVSDAVEGAHSVRDSPSLVEGLHAAQDSLGLGWLVAGLVRSVQVLKRQRHKRRVEARRVKYLKK